ncbi:arylsulfatase [Flavobacterium faecale]|uniref:Arylsulfatase n=1 Tax=Flavobacterium faecale TaxID=1355330 RepID=A0A2S1LHY8_9FLAO|nr:arylsulfatase [Flavobacterium faecale]AWG23251.1 arylsulfatase [Flavobacterium faecale]
MKTIVKILTLVGFSLVSVLGHAQSKTKPNVIYILADDLGYGDLSCYGQKKFATPNIDKLAARGIKFTQHYSGSAVCAPSRSTLITGLHTGHTSIRGNLERGHDLEGQVAMDGTEVTIADIFKNAGYATGAFGKWGLGFIDSEGDPLNQGFDEFYGYNCQRKAHRYFPPYLWHNKEKIFLKGNDYTEKVTYAPDEIQKATLEFIVKNKKKPFFAYVPFVLPHAEIISPNDAVYNAFKGKYKEGKPFVLPNNYLSDYGPNMVEYKYASQLAPHAVYATMVTRLDNYVGEIMSKLVELGIADNTLVIFTSDNGPAVEGGADPEFFDGTAGLRGVKRDLFEGGIRAPFLAVWPNKIKGGTSSNVISAFWDMKPTFAAIVGEKKIGKTDGISLLPTLLGQKTQKLHPYMYWEFPQTGGRKAVRLGNWKGVIYDMTQKENPEFQLYDLSTDPAETKNIAKANPKIVTQMLDIMKKEHTDSVLFPFK